MPSVWCLHIVHAETKLSTTPQDTWNRPAADYRAIEVLASGLPVYQGAQLVVDVTVRSALTANGSACVGAATTDVVALARARGDKERKYHELFVGERSRLVVVDIETRGRWSGEAANFISDLAGVRARSAPLLRGSAFFVWRKRWMRMLSVSCGRSFASSLVSARADADG